MKKRKSLKRRFFGYISIAAAFTAALAIYSFFVIFNMSGQLGEAGEPFLRGYVIFQIIFWIAFFIDAIFVMRNMQKIESTINMVASQALSISEGKSIVRATHDENNELGDLAFSINALLNYMNDRTSILDVINEGDYSVRVEPRGEVDKLSRAIIRIINTNNEILYEIKEAALGMNNIASGISSGADALSSGTTEQAATIEQFSAVMSEVQSMADQTAEIAQETRKIALSSRHVLERNNSDIKRMTAAMDSITESSHRIETVIKVIDEIAFQTNILALNAAIEAARAGVHGKGFAVVADEVRELASKSAAAAKETSDLIQMSIQSVYEGNDIVRQTAENILVIEEGAMSAVDNMDLLAESAESQRLSITDINRGVEQISNVIQANAITALENSSSAQKMAAQSAQLTHIVERFKLRGHDQPPLSL